MKLYASENENLQLKHNKQCEYKQAIKLTQEGIYTPIESHSLIVYSLEQHDRELLQEFYNYIDENAYYEHGMIDFREHLLENFIKELVERGLKT